MKRLIVASTNPGKIREVQLALHDLRDWIVEALPSGASGIEEVEETGATFAENAALKAAYYSRATGNLQGLTLADDSGLCVEALDNRPGLHSARYAPTAEARNQRVLSELTALDDPPRRATFICALALAQNGSIVWTVEGKLQGEITRAPSGTFGFGYDPIFMVPELGKTLAELSPGQKNQISARGRALAGLRHFLEA